ncbi:Abi family protein [Staphylococcus xylosus]
MSESLKMELKQLENAMYKEELIDIDSYKKLDVNLKFLDYETKEDLPYPFTIDQMLEKLESNNLFFPENDSKQKCIGLLNSVGYYNLKHFMYSEFGKKEKKNFDFVYTLYEFDRYLLKQLYSLVNMLEVHIRNLILDIYMLEIEERVLHPSLFYLDKSIYFEQNDGKYSIKSKKRKEFNRLQNVFWKAIEQKKSNENVLHNKEKYNAIPAWVLFQNLSFGDLSTFYSSTLSTNRNKVSKKMESLIKENTGLNIKIPERLLSGWLNSIRYLRNKVAHTDIIYGINLANTCKEHKKDEEIFIKIKNANYQQRLVTFLLAMQKFFMSMPVYNINIWNETLEKIESKSLESEVIKLSRLGIIENDIEYLKIKLTREQN